MRRREFITLLGGAAAWPLAARAQQTATKLSKVGVLEPYSATDPGYRVAQAFHDVGIEEGRDILVEWRYAEGDIKRIPALATDLAGLKPDAIVAIGDVAIRALRAETATIPIVAGTDDLVGEGYAASLSHPRRERHWDQYSRLGAQFETPRSPQRGHAFGVSHRGTLGSRYRQVPSTHASERGS